MIIPETPTVELINRYLKKFNNDDRYYSADQAINKLFKTFPANKNLEDILLKISVINDLYSTNIYGTFIMAKHIQRLDIDKRLKEGDPGLVSKIATGHEIRTNKTDKEINFYSFATKYCNWHNPKAYAIYDSFVEKILLAYRRKDNFSKFKNSDLKSFKRFKGIIDDLIKFYKLDNHNLKEIDKFLWIYSKELFKTSIKK